MPTPDLQSLAAQVTCAAIVDAMGRAHDHRAHLLDLVSPTPGKVLFGPAVTLAYFPYRHDLQDSERHNFARLYYEAVGNAPAGKVLVLSSGGHRDASLGGGTKLSRLHNQGLAGLLCDGRLRDFHELAAYRFVTYCAGETTRWGGDRVMPFAANVPVVVDGVGVLPGDYVYADGAGAVIVPAGDVRAVLEEAVRIEAADARFIEQIRAEDPDAVRKRGSREQ